MELRRLKARRLVRFTRDDDGGTLAELAILVPLLAVMLAAGLDGIRRELPVHGATDENLYEMDRIRRNTLARLPGSLEEALEELDKDDVIREALGAHTFERFVGAKQLEWEDYRLEVSSWELNKYLPNY